VFLLRASFDRKSKRLHDCLERRVHVWFPQNNTLDSWSPIDTNAMELVVVGLVIDLKETDAGDR
jgi:hypothetical protein